MESAWVIACQWVAETGEIVWEIGARRWQHELNLASGHQGFAFWRDLLGESEAARLAVESMAAAADGREVEFRCSVLSRDSHTLEVRLGGTPIAALPVRRRPSPAWRASSDGGRPTTVLSSDNERIFISRSCWLHARPRYFSHVTCGAKAHPEQQGERNEYQYTFRQMEAAQGEGP